MTRQITPGVFLISWINPEHGVTGQYEVKIVEVQQLCSVHFFETIDRTITLEMAVSPIQNITAFDPSWQVKSAVAVRRGVQQSMEYRNSKWDTTFKVKRIGYNVRLSFDIVIDFTSVNMEIVKSQSKLVVDRMLYLWLTKQYADIAFDLGERTILAHSVIVAPASPVLGALFKNEFQRIATINDIKPEVFDRLLRFIYSGDADFDNSNVWHLLLAAKKCGIVSLQEECASYIAKYLSVERATKYLICSYLHDISSLYRHTLDFMAKNGKDICSRPEWIKNSNKYPEIKLVATRVMENGYCITFDRCTFFILGSFSMCNFD